MAELLESRNGRDLPAVAATANEAAFAELADHHRRELQVHCARILGCFEESEDLVQETFLRAWRWRKSFQGNSSLRAWLYRIATNACIDALRRRDRELASSEGAEALRTVEDTADADADPASALMSREVIELAFTVAIENLPPRQRAALILCGMLRVPAKDAASLLDASVASVNSALQRARQTLREQLPDQRLEWVQGTEASEEGRALLHRYLDAIEHADADAFVEALR